MKQKEDKMPRKERGAKDASPAKEHKEPWQAKYATPKSAALTIIVSEVD